MPSRPLEIPLEARRWHSTEIELCSAPNPTGTAASSTLVSPANVIRAQHPDATRTVGPAAPGVTVGVLHTGRHYPDDLASAGIEYHYPQGRTVTEVAARYGVARHTLHRWLDRYQTDGIDGLEDRSHRPKSCPHQMPVKVEAAVVALRRVHTHWSRMRWSTLRVVRSGTVSISGLGKPIALASRFS